MSAPTESHQIDDNALIERVKKDDIVAETCCSLEQVATMEVDESDPSNGEEEEEEEEEEDEELRGRVIISMPRNH
ncbi:hypothetical protein Dimus_028301 [Dionaea muscipula]